MTRRWSPNEVLNLLDDWYDGMEEGFKEKWGPRIPRPNEIQKVNVPEIISQDTTSSKIHAEQQSSVQMTPGPSGNQFKADQSQKTQETKWEAMIQPIMDKWAQDHLNDDNQPNSAISGEKIIIQRGKEGLAKNIKNAFEPKGKKLKRNIEDPTTTTPSPSSNCTVEATKNTAKSSNPPPAKLRRIESIRTADAEKVKNVSKQRFMEDVQRFHTGRVSHPRKLPSFLVLKDKFIVFSPQKLSKLESVGRQGKAKRT